MSLLRRSLLSLGWGAFALSLAGPAFGNFNRVSAGAWQALLWLLPALGLAVVLVLCQRLTGTMAPPSESRKSRPLFVPVRALVMLVAFCVGAAVSGVAWRAVGNTVYRSATAEAHGAGYRWDRPPSSKPNPSEDNAVTWLVRAGVTTRPGAVPKDFFGPGKIQGKDPATFLSNVLHKARTGTITTSDLADARALVEANREALGLLERAVQAKETTWGIDYDKPGPNVEMMASSNVNNIARLRAAEAIVLARSGKPDEAADKLRAGFWLADAAATSSPSLIAALASAGVNAITLSAAESVLPAISSERARSAWEAYLSRDASATRFKQAVVHDYFSGVEAAAALGPLEIGAVMDWLTGRDMGALSDPIAMLYWPFIGFDVASAYRYETRVLACTNLPYARMNACLAESNNETQGRRRVWILGAVARSPIKGTYVRGLIATAQMRLARLAIAAKEHREAHGVWPESLEQLKSAGIDPSVFRDPFAESEMRIRTTGQTLIMHSVGWNGVDDQGAKDDIVWTQDAPQRAPSKPPRGRNRS